MEKKIIKTDKAPGAIGPYSQAVQIGSLLYTSGQIPLDPATGEIVKGDIKLQTKRVLDNLAGILAAAGSSFEQVVKTMVFIKDMNDFSALNEVYAEYFVNDYPARSCVEVARLPKDVKVEIELVALVQES